MDFYKMCKFNKLASFTSTFCSGYPIICRKNVPIYEEDISRSYLLPTTGFPPRVRCPVTNMSNRTNHKNRRFDTFQSHLPQHRKGRGTNDFINRRRRNPYPSAFACILSEFVAAVPVTHYAHLRNSEKHGTKPALKRLYI